MSVTPERLAEIQARHRVWRASVAAGRRATNASQAAHDRESLLDALTPAWTPGPPTEPGEWWVTVAWGGESLVGETYGSEVVRGGRRWWVYADAWRGGRWVMDHAIPAHAPLLRPEPWRPT